MTAWLPVLLPCVLAPFLWWWLLRHAGPWRFAAPKRRQVIRGEVEPPQRAGLADGRRATAEVTRVSLREEGMR